MNGRCAGLMRCEDYSKHSRKLSSRPVLSNYSELEQFAKRCSRWSEKILVSARRLERIKLALLSPPEEGASRLAGAERRQMNIHKREITQQ